MSDLDKYMGAAGEAYRLSVEARREIQERPKAIEEALAHVYMTGLDSMHALANLQGAVLPLIGLGRAAVERGDTNSVRDVLRVIDAIQATISDSFSVGAGEAIR